MTTDRELARKLAALSQASQIEDGAIVLGAVTGTDALAAVLEAIDNTMLPRALLFKAGEASVTLAVGGRRLRALAATSGDVAAPEGLVGKQLTRDDETDLKAIAEVVLALSEKGPIGLVRTEPAQGGGSSSDTGVGIGSLSKLWDADPYAADVPLAEKFLAALGDAVIAMKVLEPTEEALSKGAKKTLAALDKAYEDKMQGCAQAHAQLYPDAVGTRCLTQEGLLDGGELVSFVELEGQVILVVTTADSWENLASAWPAR